MLWRASLQEVPMMTAVVRYKLPPQIDYAACRDHFHKIAPGFREVTGLISKHFIWSESGWAGGVYQWERGEDAKAVYTAPWFDRLVERYGIKTQSAVRGARCRQVTLRRSRHLPGDGYAAAMSIRRQKHDALIGISARACAR